MNSGRRRPPRPRPPPLARTPARSLALHAPGVKNHSTVHLPPSTLLPWTDTTDKHALESVATAAAIGLVPRSSTLDFFHQLQLSYPILPTDRTDRTYLPYLHPTDRTYLAHPAQTRSTRPTHPPRNLRPQHIFDFRPSQCPAYTRIPLSSMEYSSPLAAMRPQPVPAWGGRKDLSGSRSMYHGCQTLSPNSFDFNTMSMHMAREKPRRPDYFSLRPVRGSSPTASLTADLDANFHIDKR